MRRLRRKSGLSTVVGTLFFIAVVFVAIGAFIVMFNAFSGYGNSLKSLSQEQHQNQLTSISISGMSFGSSPNKVTTSTASTATSISSERKVLYSQGLWWDFYSTGNSISYQTSPDGFTWSTPTIVTSSSGSQYGTTFNVWQVQSTVYYVLTTPDGSKSFVWRYGTLNSGGTISWSISETNVTTTGTSNYYNSITVDTSGNTWVAFNSIESSSNNHVEVWEHLASSAPGTWSKITDISSLPSDATPILVPLSSGSIALIYGTGAKTGQVFIVTSSTGWNTPVSPSSDYAMFDSSAVAIGNTVYFGGLGSTTSGSSTGTVNFWSFTSGLAGVSTESVLQSTSNSWSVALTGIGTSLALMYGSGANLYYITTQNLGASFSTPLSVSTSEVSLAGLNSGYAALGMSWASGTSSPYNVRFASLGDLSISNGSPFAIHAVSLYIYNPSTTALVHFDINATGPGVSGVFDYWIGSARSLNVPLIFAWSTSQNYLVTVTTDQGNLASLTVTSPS
jgi:hypothetical protein